MSTMTTQSDFKARIRERMSRTGERYAAARAVLLAQATPRPPAPSPSAGVQLLPGYDRIGGIHAESAVLANVLRQAGVVAPHTGEPFEESFLYGLAGGIGFMYFAFEYTNLPPMLSVVLRCDSYPDAFVRRGLERSGAALEWRETGSPVQAARHLADALAKGHAPICVTDMTGLPWYGMPIEHRGFAPHYVAVAGQADDVVALDDRAARPLLLSTEAFAEARAGYRKGRHRLVTVAPVQGGKGSDQRGLAAVVLEAIRATARGFHEAPYAGFGSNFGLRGLDKWARLIGDPRDAKGWRRLLANDQALAAALTRMYEGIEVEFTAPAGGRRLYATFLDEASALTRRTALRTAADLYRAAGERWTSFARAALPETEPTLDSIRRLVDQRVENLDTFGDAAAEPNRTARAEVDALQLRFAPPPDVREALLSSLAAQAISLVDVERQALEALEAAVG
jgi:hypothetical protein